MQFCPGKAADQFVSAMLKAGETVFGFRAEADHPSGPFSLMLSAVCPILVRAFYPGNVRYNRGSRVAPPLASRTIFWPQGVGLLFQFPHCLGKNGMLAAMHRLRKLRTQAASVGRILAAFPPVIIQSVPSRGILYKSVKSSSQNRPEPGSLGP